MNSLVKTKKQVSTVMVIVMLLSIFVGGITLPVLANNERIDQGSDVIIPLAATQAPKAKKSVNKGAILGAVVAGSIVAISGLPMLTVAAGAVVGYAGVALTKKAIGLFSGKKTNDTSDIDYPVLGVVDNSLAEQESDFCEEFLANMNKSSTSSEQNYTSSTTSSYQSHSSNLVVKQDISISSEDAYASYQKAYKEYLSAVQDGDASLANEKFAEYKKCKEVYQDQVK